MIVEGTPQSAVVWSKPEDLEMDWDDPLDGLKGSTNRGFHVGMGDGAVNFMTDSVDPETPMKNRQSGHLCQSGSPLDHHSVGIDGHFGLDFRQATGRGPGVHDQVIRHPRDAIMMGVSADDG